MSEEERKPQGARDKRGEKEEEKQEKSFDEKWRRDPIDAAAWAVILIWGGLVLLAGNLGLFDRFEAVEGWDLFFVGAGIILLLAALFVVLVPDYRRPVGGKVILGFVFLGIGLSSLVNWNWGVIVGLVVIAVGVFLLLAGARRRQE
jgi:hypothetical protein